MWPPWRGLRIPPRRDFACSAGRGRGPRQSRFCRCMARHSSSGEEGSAVSQVSSMGDSPRMPGAASVRMGPVAAYALERTFASGTAGSASGSSGGNGGRWGPCLRQIHARNPPMEAPERCPSQLTPSSIGKTPHTMLPYRKTTTMATRMSRGWRRRMPLRNRKATCA